MSVGSELSHVRGFTVNAYSENRLKKKFFPLMQQGMPLGMCNIWKKMNWYVKKCQTRPDDRMIATKNNSI